MKKLLFPVFTFIIVCLITFSGCFSAILYERAGEFGEMNVIELYYNKYTKKAFASSYFWDGDESKMEITVPDTCNGCKVTDLGGYYGSGGICPFAVNIPEIFRDKESIANYGFIPEESNEQNTETFTFKVNIGKNLKNLNVLIRVIMDTETEKQIRLSSFM